MSLQVEPLQTTWSTVCHLVCKERGKSIAMTFERSWLACRNFPLFPRQREEGPFFCRGEIKTFS
eukprot:6456896-Amphidinium_carterae.1